MTETLIVRRFTEIDPEPERPLETLEQCRRMPGCAEIVEAIQRSEFKDVCPTSKIRILERYLRDGMDPFVAMVGIEHGYSSPSEWRIAHRIHRRIGLTRADFKPRRIH